MGTEDLRLAYLELMMEEPGTALETFLERVAHGRYGPQNGMDITEFLHDVERNILSSIQTRAATNPRWAEQAEERSEETREEISALIARFARDAPAVDGRASPERERGQN